MESGPVEVVFSLGTTSDGIGNHGAELFHYVSGPVKVPGPWKRGRPRGTTKQEKKYCGNAANGVAPPKLKFVHVSPGSKGMDKTSQTMIRRHVRRRRGSQNANRDAIGIQHNVGSQASSVLIPQQIPGVDPFNRSPIKLQPYMHDLLLCFRNIVWEHFYSLERLAGCNPVAEYWLPLAFQDAALLHSLIGCAEAYVSGYRTIKDESRGLRHLQTSISIVNQRLKAPEDVVSGATIGVVAGVAMLQKGVGRHDHWRIHMQGLQRLVHLYGGLERLYLEPMILYKVYRADLYGSLDAAHSPFFTKACPILSGLSDTTPFQSPGFNDMHKAFGLDKSLRICLHHLEEAMLFWSHVRDSTSRNDDAHTTKPTSTEAARVRFLLTGIQYSLVSVNVQESLGDVAGSHISELCRITLIIYSLTILNERAPSTSFGAHIGTKLRRALSGLAGQSYNHVLRPTAPVPVDFQLWSIFLAASVMMNTESDTRSWLLASFVELASLDQGKVGDWQDLQSWLSRYLWVPSIHDARFRWLWSEMAERRGTEESVRQSAS